MTRSMGPGGHASDLRRSQRAIDQIRSELSRFSTRLDGTASASELAQLQAQVNSTPSQVNSTPSSAVTAAASTVTLEQGVSYYDVPNGYLYIVFGRDGNWEAVRHGATDQSTGTQGGPTPTTLSALQALTYS